MARVRGLVPPIAVIAGVLGLLAAGLVAAPEATAKAATFPTHGSGVNIRSETTTSSRVVGKLPTGARVRVGCQMQGRPITIGGRRTSWWAHLPDYGGFITVAYVKTTKARLPGVPVCDFRKGRDITLADLRAMFPGKVGHGPTVSAGLPSLNRAMRDAHITTAARKAAFLTTIAHESTFLFNARERGDTRWFGGRGFIQLTGTWNYQSAGTYFGIDLERDPGLARSKAWSGPLARWYWTVARDINPKADRLDMGAVNAAIGYPAGPHDKTRCASFQRALKYLSGKTPKGVKCARPTSSSETIDPADAKGLGLGD
jgi:putative chitinase